MLMTMPATTSPPTLVKHMMKNTMAMIGAMMSQGRYLPFLKWNLSMNTPAKRADTVSTADALAMTPEMASGSCATSVRKNRKKAVSRVAAIEKPISDTPQTERMAVLILGMVSPP